MPTLIYAPTVNGEAKKTIDVSKTRGQQVGTQQEKKTDSAAYKLSVVQTDTQSIQREIQHIQYSGPIRKDINIKKEMHEVRVNSEVKKLKIEGRTEGYQRSAHDNAKFIIRSEPIPIHLDDQRNGCTSPPWDECYDDTEQENFLAFHSEESWVNCNTGHGYGELVGSCGWAQWVRSHAWCWYKGYFDCNSTGDYVINFVVDYDGLVSIVDFPFDIGLGNLEIEANIVYQFAGQPTQAELIFWRDSWPTIGDYQIPSPYDPPGPYTYGYSNPIALQAGYRYEFAVQFNLYLDCAAFGFTVSAGGISLNNSFLSADISGPPPSNVDLISEGIIQIGEDLYYTIFPDPQIFSPGETVDLYANVWNDGLDDATGFYVAIGVDGVGYSGGPFNCPAGGINNGIGLVLENYPWPNDLDVHYIWCLADCYDDIAEVNEDNNFGYVEWAAVGPPDIEITDITLIKYNPAGWPPDPNNIDWMNPDIFNVGDRVVPLAGVCNNGDGPSFNLLVQYYEDNTLMADGTFSLGADACFVINVDDGSGYPGFIWDDPDCMNIKWEIHDYDYGQHDSKNEDYCPEPEERTITFYMNPTDGGTITFDGSTYSNGQNTQKPDGQYSVSANPATNYEFDHWATTGGVSVANPNSQSTTATVSGNGGITAHFSYIPEQRTVSFSIDPTNGGTITFEGSTYSHGQNTQVADGQYPVFANPTLGCVFDHWTTTGGVSVADSNSQSTTATVSGDGGIELIVNCPGCVDVSLPDTSGCQGQTLEIPLTVGDVTGLNVIAFEFTVNFDSQILEPFSPYYSESGTMADGWSIYQNHTTSSLTVGGFWTAPLSGSGTLIKIVLRVRDTALIGSSSILDIVSFVFNDGIPCVNVQDGSVEVTPCEVDITGVVNYHSISALPVPDLTVDINPGDPTTTNGLGEYEFLGLTIGTTYVVTPKVT